MKQMIPIVLSIVCAFMFFIVACLGVYNFGKSRCLDSVIKEGRLMVILPTLKTVKVAEIKWYKMENGDTIEIDALDGLTNQSSIGMILSELQQKQLKDFDAGFREKKEE